MKSVPSPEHSVPIKTLTLSCLKSMPSSGTANEPMATIFNQELFVLTAILCFKMEPTLRNRASRISISFSVLSDNSNLKTRQAFDNQYGGT